MPISSLLSIIPRKKRFIVFLLAFITGSVASWAVPFQYPSTGLDPSWAQALVQATDSGRIFGRDIIFTFGPLHQAVTAQVSTNIAPHIFSRLSFTAIWLIAQILIGTLIGCWAEASIALAVLISAGSHGDLIFYLIALVGIVSTATARLRTADRNKLHSLLLSVTLLSGSLLATLVKLSYIGAFIPVFAYAAGIYMLDVFDQKSFQSFWRLIAIIAFPLLILLAAWSATSHASIGDLLHYYYGPNLDVVKGYTDAMSYDVSKLSLLLVLLYVLSFIILLFLFSSLVLGVKINSMIMRQLTCSPSSFLALACISLLAWVVFKSSFVRDDSGHTLLGGLFLVSFLFIIIGFSGRRLPNSLVAENGEYVVLGLIIPLITAGSLSILSGYRPSPSTPLRYAKGFLQSFKLLSPAGQKWFIANRESGLKEIKENSEDYKIQKNFSADVIPWNISYLIANDLTYKPRPVPQSYAVYSRNLQDINKRFFADMKESPDWVIVDINDIDGRLPIGLDSSSLASIKRFYSFSHEGSEGSLVFSKKRNFEGDELVPISNSCTSNIKGYLEWLKIGKIRWQSKPLVIPREKTGFVILDVELKDSLSRSLLSTFYRPFPVVIEYLNSAGEIVASYRFIPKAGREMIVYPIIKDNAEFLNVVYLGMPTRSDEIVSLRLATRNIMPPFSRSKYTFSFGCSSS